MESMNVDPSTVIGAAICLLMWAAGIVSNVARRLRSQNITLKQYWTVDFGRSIVSVLVSVAAILLFFYNREQSVFAYFSIGYIADSLINKADAQTPESK